MYTPSNARPQFIRPELDPNLIAHPSQDISGGLESLFNNYLAMKQNQRSQTGSENQNAIYQQQLAAGNRASAGQNLQETVQFGAPLTTFNPDQLQQASTQATSQDQQMAQDQEHPMIAHLRSGINQIRQQRQAQMAESGATLAKTQAETAKTQSEAALNGVFTGAAGVGGGQGGGLDAWASQLRDDVQSGRKAPSQAQAEASRLGPNGMGRLIVDKALAGLDQASLEANFKGKEAGATLENSAAIQVPARLQKSLMPSFDYLDTISQNADKSQYQLINKHGIAIAASMGDRMAQHLQDVSNAISEEFAANLGGTGSDAKLHLGMSLFDKAKTPEQIHDAVTFMKHNAINRSEAYLGKEPSAIPIPAQFGGASQNAPAAPAVGAQEGGYKFRGGNPALPASWVKI